MDLWWKGAEDAVRWNAIACGALFAVLGFALKRTGRKAHFEPVAVTLGWLLVLGALASRVLDARIWWAWTLGLLLVGLGLAAGAFLVRRFLLFAFGVVAAYAALSRLALDRTADTLGCFWFFLTPILVIVGLILAQRRLKEPA
jgi:hypothetical protein